MFYIRKDRKMGGFVLIRVGFPKEYHSHTKTMAGAQQIIRLIERNVEPNQKWMQEAVRRLLTPKEYRGLKKPKDGYHNKPRRA